jgi:hypothetical protein
MRQVLKNTNAHTALRHIQHTSRINLAWLSAIEYNWFYRFAFLTIKEHKNNRTNPYQG